MQSSALLIMPGCALASRTPVPPPEAGVDGARGLMQRFVDLMYQQRRVRAAFESCVVPSGFIDHTADLPGGGGRASVMAQLRTQLAGPDLQVDLQHLAVDGDTAVVHLLVRAGDAPPARRVDIFRIAGDRIVEHWGVGG